MRKIGEKVALVAQICVAIVFVIVAMLYVAEIIPQNVLQDNTILFVMMAVLSVVFVGTSVYLVYVNFSEAQNLRRILLHADCKSATTTTITVANKIAHNCAYRIDGVKIKKTKIRADDKKGYVATFVVEVSALSVTPALEELRCLIEDSFKDTLGLTFNTITFEVAKLTGQPKADVKKAKKRAQALTDGVEQVQDIYQNPTGERSTDIALPLPSEQVDVGIDDDIIDEQVDDVDTQIDTTQADATEFADQTVDQVDSDQVDNTDDVVDDDDTDQLT